MERYTVPALAICALTLLELAAIAHGINGTLFLGITSAISAIGGAYVRPAKRG